jgi:opacity protein-like surface antigen
MHLSDFLPPAACVRTVAVLGASLIWAAAIQGSEIVATQPEANPEKGLESAAVSCEASADYSYVGSSKTKAGVADLGNISEQAASTKAVVSRHLTEGCILRTGASWERYSFGLPDAMPLPTTLQSVSAVLGADFELSDQWIMRAEIQPGVYSDFDDISFDDVNAPLVVGGSYLVDKNLQWFLGLSVDARRRYPVLPGGGVRWKFANQWTLMFLLPKPRLEYDLSEKVILYMGADLRGGTFKLGKNFGSNHGRQNLNNVAVDFSEVRMGTGVTWEIRPGLKLDLEGGYMVFREFDFHTVDVSFDGRPAPYGQIAISANF